MHIYSLKFLIVLFFYAYACLVNLANATEVLDLSVQKNGLNPTRAHLTAFQDPTDEITIEYLIQNYAELFQPIEEDTLVAGHTNDSVWAHFSVTDNTIRQGSNIWLFEVDYTMLKRLNIYVAKQGEVIHRFDLGYENPIAERLLPYRTFIQPIELQSGETYEIFINARRSGGNIKIPIAIHSPIEFLAKEITSNYLFGMLFGVMLAMAIYNTFIYLSVREQVYLAYICYIIFCATVVLAISGYGNLLFWGNYPLVNHYIISISACLAVISALWFTHHFISQEFQSKAMGIILIVFAAIGIGLIIYKLISGRYIGLEITLYISVVCTAAPFAMTYSWLKGSRSAGFFLISWSVFLVCDIFYLLALIGMIPTNAFTQNGVVIGAAAEMMLLSWGLADRINRLKKAQFLALQEKHDATVQLKEAEDRLIHRALHSGSTGLPNRAYVRSSLDELIEKDSSPQFALFIFNLNNFHEINKTFGHSGGETILDAFVERLKDLCADIPSSMCIECASNANVHVAAVEGVTFAVLVNELNNEKLLRYGMQLISEIEKPFEYDELFLNIDASLGIALYPCHGETSEVLIRNAQIALEASHTTSEKIAIYSQKIDPYNERRISLIGALKNTLANDALDLHFQPQIDLATGRVAGLEALVRWTHEEYGFIPPDEFIPLAERSGVIQSLTYWVVNRAFNVKSSLDSKGINLVVSINVSARNLQDPNFARYVCDLAKQHSIDLREVVLELTETALMTDPELAKQVMTDLNREGVLWSIDDFGTGHASLSYIRKLPVHEIKIDRSFVMDMVKNYDDQVIVNTTLLMGHNLNLRVVAEGIEDQPTQTKLKEMGCDLAQGYHIGRPMPEDALLNWIKEYQSNVKTLGVIQGVK